MALDFSRNLILAKFSENKVVSIKIRYDPTVKGISIFENELKLSLQQHNTVLRIPYLQSQLTKAIQYLQYITYSNLLTIHVTVLTIYYLQ